MRGTLRVLVAVGIAVLLLAAAVGVGAEGEASSRVSPVLDRDFRISGPNATWSEDEPAVVSNQTAGEYLAVWHDWRDSSTRGSDIYGRRVGADGARIGGDFRISGPNATSEDQSPAVAWNQTADEYLAVWHDWRDSSTRGSDIYGRRVGAEGRGDGQTGMHQSALVEVLDSGSGGCPVARGRTTGGRSLSNRA